MMRFTDFVESLVQQGPTIVTAVKRDDGIYLKGNSLSKKTVFIGPLLNLKQEGDAWIASTKLGRFMINIDQDLAEKIIKLIKAVWFYRGIKAQEYLFIKPEQVRQYEDAEKILKNRHTQPNNPQIAAAEQTIKSLGKLYKGAFFSSSIEEAKTATGPGGSILAIQLPQEVYKNYLYQGSIVKGVGPSLLIPGTELEDIVKRYPHKLYKS